MMKIRIKSKLWIEFDGLPVFGKGRRLLLEAGLQEIVDERFKKIFNVGDL